MTNPISPPPDDDRESVLHILSAAAFVVFFQAYLVAPLIPSLAAEFSSSQQTLGYVIPAYLLPYGFFTLFYGPLSDRTGRRPVLLSMLAAMTLATAGAATSHSLTSLLLWRILAGVASGGIIPISLALLADLFPYNQRGRALGWIFGAIAGGMAFGSTLGAILNPLIGWRAEFLLLSLSIITILLLATKAPGLRSRGLPPPATTLKSILSNYLSLLQNPRGKRTYTFIFLNAIFHSGVYSWLGSYFFARYHLSDPGIGLALLGYGIPGLLLGPLIGRLADRFGRRHIIPAGLLLSSASAALLAPHAPLVSSILAVTTLSLGLDMSHPLLTGIITSLDPLRRGQALGLNAFALFTGMGAGSLLFQSILPYGFTTALTLFALLQFILALAGLFTFQSESPAHAAQHA